MANPESFLTLTHSMALLAEPAFGAPVVALLQAGDQLRSRTIANGFAAVETIAGARGFVPEAMCGSSPAAGNADPPIVKVIRNITLYRSPTPGDQYGARWLVPPEELLLVLEDAGMFRKIRRSNGQIGYVPATLCRVGRTPAGETVCRLVQTVALYSSPTPGGQYEARWQISPTEELVELGRVSRFVLIQRESGELGYLPVALCGQAIADSILPIGPIDLGWIAVGGGWGLANWGGLALTLYRLEFVDMAIKPYLGLAILLGAVAAVWFGQRKPLIARSFAGGVLLAYLLLHFNSGGLFTLWR